MKDKTMLNLVDQVLDVAAALGVAAVVAALISLNVNVDFFAKSNLPFTMCGALVIVIIAFTVREVRR